MRKTTIDRGRKAIALIRQGETFTKAALLAKIDIRTLKKVMRKLKVRRTRKKGRLYIVTEYYKRVIDRLIYYMMGGWSATRAAHASHTTIRTMRKMFVRVKGRRRSVIVRPDGRYKLNVYKTHGYPAVFYGRLRSRHDNTYTGTTVFKREVRDDELRDDGYANILWQVDFDPFTSTMLADDVCEHYPERILALLRAYLMKPISVNDKAVNKDIRKMARTRAKYVVETMLDIPESDLGKLFAGTLDKTVTRLEMILGHAGVGFEELVLCGIDEDYTKADYYSPTDLMKNRRRPVDVGYFTIIVRRKNRSLSYPPVPVRIPFKHDLVAEAKLPRRAPG